MYGKLGTLFVDIESRDKLTGSLMGLGSRVSALGATLTRRLTLPILAATGAAVGMGVKLSASLEQSKIAFTTMLGSAKKANAFIEKMKRFAAKTPFEFEGLQHAARMLLAYGFEAKKILPTLRSVGDAVAGLGGGAVEIQRATRALGQMRAKGKIASQEMLQLTELGIPAWEILAKKMNKSTDEVMEMVRKRQISAAKGIEMIVEGMGERFPDMMKKQSKTLIGVWSTFKDEMSFILMDIGDAIVKNLNLKQTILNLSAWFKQNREVIVKAIASFVRGVRDFFRVLAPIARAIGRWIAANPKLAGTLVALLAALGPVIWMTGKFIQVAAGLRWIFVVAIPFIKAALVGLGVAAWPVVAVIAALAAVAAVLYVHWDKFSKVLAPVTKAFKELWSTLKTLFYELWRVLKPLLLPVIKMVAGAIGIALLVALSAVAQVLVLIINVITGVIKIFIGLGRVIYGVGEILWGFVTGNRKMMAQGVKDMQKGASEIGDGFKTIVVDSAKSIYDITKATVEGIGEMLGKGNTKAAEAAEKGGKAVGDKHSKGKKDGLKKGENDIEDTVDEDGRAATKRAKKHGEDAGEAWSTGIEGGLVGMGARALKPSKSDMADKEELEAHLHRRKAYWKAYAQADIEGADRQMKLAEAHERKADRLRGKSDDKVIRDKKTHHKKREGLFKTFQRNVNKILKDSLNKQSGIFLLSRKNRLAAQKGFQIRERFATKNHQTLVAGIWKFAGNQIANLDRLFKGQRKTRRVTANTGERRATKYHWSRILFITSLALFGPAGLLAINFRFGKRLIEWLKGAFTRQRGVNKRHWTFTKIITRLGLVRIFNMMKRKINQFGNWLVKIPRMFYNRIMRKASWMYRAGRGLVRRMIKGVKNTFNDLTKAGKKAGKSTRKGAQKGGKGIGKDGKKIGRGLRKGFRKGSAGAGKDGRKAGRQVGKGFGKGAKKGAKKNGVKTAKEFIQGLRKRLGIQSPSMEARKLGVAVSQGFNNGVGWQKLKQSSAKKMGDVTNEMQKVLMKFNEWLRGLPKLWKHTLLLNAHYMGEAGKALAKTLIGAVKARLGISSPSKEFQKIGKYMIMGLIEGMSQDDLMSVLYNQFGGWETFAKHILDVIQGNLGKGWAWLTDFLGTDSQALYAALQERFGADMGFGGALSGVALEVGNVDMMRAIAEWLISQDPDSNSSISSLFRPGDPRQHGKGQAVDIAPGSDKIANLAAKIIGYAGDWGADTKGAFGVLSTDFGQVLWKTMVGGNHWNHVHLGIKAISDFLKNLTTGAGGGDVWTQVKNAFDDHWPAPQQLADLKSLLMAESGMDPQADNPNSDAWGLFQFMLNLHAKPGGYLPRGMDSTLQEQIAGGIRYIRNAYGSPSEAWRMHQSRNPHWYEGGGEVSATLHSGERVLTQQQNRWFTALARPLASLLSGAGEMSYTERDRKVTAVIPNGTQFKIIDLHNGIVEAVGEGFDLYDENKAKDLRKVYRGR